MKQTLQIFKKVLFVKIIALTFFISKVTFSQSGSLDSSFDSGIGTDDNVGTVAIQTDGKILIGGNFISYNGVERNRIARLNIDGSLDTTFNPGTGASSGVYTISIQSDGKIIIGGFFTYYNGINRNRIARLNANGSLDGSFNPGTGIGLSGNHYLKTTAIQSDGKIIIGGEFTSYDGFSRNRIARINMNGSLDTSFDPGTGTDSYVWNIGIQNDGKIIIVGDFIYYNGYDRNRIARINPDGSLDTSFNPGSGAWYGPITAVAIQNDGKIIIGGHFQAFNGTIRYYIARLNTDGSLDTSFDPGGGANYYVRDIKIQSDGKIIICGYFTYYNGTSRNYIARLNPDGSLDTSFDPGTGANCYIEEFAMTQNEKLIIGGCFSSYNGITSNRIARINADVMGVLGGIFNDINENCIYGTDELGLKNRNLLINPGNIIVQSNNYGWWYLDSLPAGNYTITADTSGQWKITCPTSQNFTVVHPDSVTYAPSFGFISTTPCASPEISIQASILRRCFSNQKIYVQTCNLINATGALNSAYVDVKLDNLLTVQSATLAYTMLGNNVYRFNVGTLNPGMCTNFSISCSVSCNAATGQTLCMEANLYPADSCVFDTIPGVGSTCTTQWDNSSLTVEGSCVNDSIRFVVYNTGDSIDGDMTCYSPVRIYIDGELMFWDSVQLGGGDSTVFIFSGDGRTWRLEADQHPLHPGNSHPNATIELCGDSVNWTSDLVNIFPMDDAEPVSDIFCRTVRGSYDPNDKIGYPLGLSDSSFISPNQQLQYVINFQNTGNDTAFTVIIRDTLDTNLNIFSVVPGVASHNYTFKMYGSRVLEWTFDNILLPDSNANEPASHGFVTFKVNQNPNLPNGTVINNSSAIYFDFNAPVITNQTFHTVNKLPRTLNSTLQSTLIEAACDSYSLNGLKYNSTGTYYQKLQSSAGTDSIITLNLTVTPSFNLAQSLTICGGENVTVGTNTYNTTGNFYDSLLTINGCDSVIFTALTVNPSPIINQQFTICNGDSIFLQNNYQIVTGTYYDTLSTVNGCDSIIISALTVNESPIIIQPIFICNGDSVLVHGNYETTDGTFYDTLSTVNGCDSVIISTLTVNPSPVSNWQLIICNGDSIFWQGNYLSADGTYYDTLSTVNGCDSVLVTTLSVNQPSLTNQQMEICSGDSVLLQGSYQTTAGNYYDTLSTVKGCDSVVVTSLSVNDEITSSQTFTICAGESIMVGTNTYNISGTYIDVLTGSNGCDSMVTTNLTVENEITFSQSPIICAGESISVGTNTYNTSGTYTDVLTASNGCDSTITTNLTVNDTISFTQSLTICAGESVIVGANTYTTAGTYTDVLTASNGCDSMVTTNLSVNDTITFSQSLTICAGESIIVGTNTYNSSGTYTDILSASNGCDSTVTTNLTVNDVISFSQSLNICPGDSITVGASTYYTSGTYTDILTAANSCDSTVITNLTVENNIDVSVSANGATLTANTSNAVYQWIDCDNGNSAIPNETNQSYTATVNGNYAVIITENSCSDTSACMNVSGLSVDLSIRENVKFSIYPNPTRGSFTVEVLHKKNKLQKLKLKIFDAQGKLVKELIVADKQLSIETKGWVKGVYFVSLVEGGKALTKEKIVLE